RKVVHFTLTGWDEVETRAPGIEEGLDLLARAVDTFGVGSVRWRFSPVPVVDDVTDRFARIAARAASLGLKEVYLSFLQPNDWAGETRSPQERASILCGLAAVTNLELRLCNEDSSTPVSGAIGRGICEDARRFVDGVKAEKCGCALAVDPFSQNEACVYGCRYCYAGNRATSPRKRNTTRLPLLGKY